MGQQLLELAFRLPHQLLAAAAGFFQQRLPLALEFGQQLFAPVPLLGGFLPQAPGVVQLPLQGRLLGVDALHDFQAGPFAFPQVLLSISQQIFGQTETPGDGKGLAGAGNAVMQPVGRRQGHGIEFHRRVPHPGAQAGIPLDEVEMGGDHGPRANRPQPIEQRHGQSAAFGRIGTGAQFVQQHQGIRPGLLQNLPQPGQMPRKGRQVLLDALLVADIGMHLGEQEHPAVGSAGNRQPGTHHEHQQTEGFEGHALAAGVGTADDQQLVCRLQAQIDRLGILRMQTAVGAAHEQRMAGPEQGDFRRGGQLRRHGTGHPGKMAAGRAHVETCQYPLIVAQSVPLVADTGGQAPQNALLFALLLALQGLQFVIPGEDRIGLDEQGLAAGRLVMHQAFDSALGIGSHRHHVPAVALGDDAILKDAVEAILVQQILQGTANPGPQPLDAVTQFAQLEGGAVENVAARPDAVPQFARQCRTGGQTRGPGRQPNRVGRRSEIATAVGRRFEARQHVQQIFARQPGPFAVELPQRLRQIPAAAQGGATVAFQQAGHLRHLGQGLGGLLRLGQRLQLPQFRMARPGHRKTGQQRQDFVEFENPQGRFVHYRLYSCRRGPHRRGILATAFLVQQTLAQLDQGRRQFGPPQGLAQGLRTGTMGQAVKHQGQQQAAFQQAEQTAGHPVEPAQKQQRDEPRQDKPQDREQQHRKQKQQDEGQHLAEGFRHPENFDQPFRQPGIEAHGDEDAAEQSQQ